MKRDLELERVYAHPVNVVWAALTDSRAIAAWLMENDFEPRVGHRFQFRTQPAPGFDGIVNCQVLEIVDQQRLAFTWKGGPIDTVITFTLEAVAEGTRLRVRQTGFSGLKSVLVSFILQSGNSRIYGRALPDLLDRIASGTFVPSHEERTCHPDGWPSVGVNALIHVANHVPQRKKPAEDESRSEPRRL